jgi:hypothetical protein
MVLADNYGLVTREIEVPSTENDLKCFVNTPIL